MQALDELNRLQSTKRCSLSSSLARRLHCRCRNPARRSQRDAAIDKLLLLVVTHCSPSSLVVTHCSPPSLLPSSLLANCVERIEGRG
ncbi:unnamed protein product [Linum trigynum]|uniref:Uncharacterized protein n=1 Tax=Linum trigynum TaxID=586398 RepID=A0AAV2CVE6_9ROSI